MNISSSQPNARGPIGIVAALHEEINESLIWLSDAQYTHIGSRDSRTGRLDGHVVVVVLSHVGKMAAAPIIAVLITQFNVRTAAFAGVAGVLASGVTVGGVVVSEELLQRGVDTSPLFPCWEIPLTGMTRSSADAVLASGLLENAGVVLADPCALLGPDVIRAFGTAAPQAHRGLIVSGDRFVCTSAGSAVLRTALPDALAAEMGGAAMAQVRHEWDASFVAIRMVSDRTDGAASADFVQFITQVDSCYAMAALRKWLPTVAGV